MARDSRQARLAKLTDLLARLERGEHVQNRALKTALTPAQYETMVLQWQEQQELRSTYSEKPAPIIEYEAKLKRADFTFNKALGYRDRNNKAASKSADDKAESLYEDVLEHLRELLDEDPSLEVWFDRPIDFGPGSLSPDSASVPRVVASRSTNALDGGHLASAKRSKREVKIDVLRDAIRELKTPDSESSVPSSKKRKELLGIKDDDADS